MSNKGRFVWYDLMTTDPAAAKAFYTETIGWKTQPFEGGDKAYTMWVAGETPIGGVMDLPEEVKKMGAPPHWLAYVQVENVDATVKQVKELGGTVHHPGMDIPKVGRFGVIADPQGATIAVFTPEQEMKLPPREQQGVYSWHELNTTDWEGAWKFYSKLFGWVESSQMDMGDGMGTYFMYKHPADGEKASLGGMSNVAKQMSMPPHWLYYATVDSCDAAIKRITSKGGKVLNGPMEVPGGGHIAQCMDPQGAAFAVYAEKK